MSTHIYRAYGLILESQIELPELRPGAGVPDVRIRRGDVPEQLPTASVRGVMFDADAANYLLRADGIARFWVRNGNDVVIDIAQDAPVLDVRMLLLGTAITALLQQRGQLVLHAGAVVGTNGAVLIAGQSGFGKSTLLAALARSGHRLLTDDIAVVYQTGNGDFMVHPGPPALKLWEDALQRLGHEGDLIRVRRDLRKYSVSYPNGFVVDPAPVSAMCVLDLHNAKTVEVVPISDAAKFAALCEQTRSFRTIAPLGAQGAHFRLGSSLIASLPMVKLRRPRGVDSTAELCRQVETWLR